MRADSYCSRRRLKLRTSACEVAACLLFIGVGVNAQVVSRTGLVAVPPSNNSGSIQHHPELWTGSLAAPSVAPLVRTTSGRAGISYDPERVDELSVRLQEANDGVAHRLKHAAVGAGIGAGVGLLVGAAVGVQHDRHPGDDTFPVTPLVAVAGLVIGSVVGLVVGAFIP
jgi:hypothetical protein